MGIICCKYDSKSDAANEIKKPTNLENSLTLYNSKNLTDSSNTEQILLRQKENPLKDYSLLLFQELNKFRLEPHKYYVESIQYNLTNVVKELIKNKNNEKEQKDLQLKWSSKNEIIIYNIMQDRKTNDIVTKLKKIKKRFEKIFDLIILYAIGNYDTIKNSLWIILKNFKNLGEKRFNKIITNKIDYCVIYSLQCDNVILKSLNIKGKKDFSESDNYQIKNLENNNYTPYDEVNYSLRDKIISFYFLFICLDDKNKNSNLENSDVVYW
jgi:hypothetical protein